MMGRKEKYQTLPPPAARSSRNSRSRGKKTSSGRKGSKVVKPSHRNKLKEQQHVSPIAKGANPAKQPASPVKSDGEETSITREVITGADGTILFVAYVIPSDPHPLPSSRRAAFTDPSDWNESSSEGYDEDDVWFG